MVSLIISALMWAVVIVLVLFRRGKKERSVNNAAIAIACSMAMSVDELYVVVDGWFGARDLIHLASAIALMVGLFYLARGVARAGDLDRPALQVLLGPPALILACTVVSGAFFLVQRNPGTSTTFMLDYGDQVATAVYSGAQYVYLTLVLVALLNISIRQVRADNVSTRSVAGVLAVGSVFGIALSADIVLMDITNVVGWDATLELAQAPYGLLQVATFALLCSGLAATPMVRWYRETRHRRGILAHLEAISPLWSRATSARPSIADELGGSDESPARSLHRRLVEIQDAALDNRNGFHLTRADRELLASAEGHLTSSWA